MLTGVSEYSQEITILNSRALTAYNAENHNIPGPFITAQQNAIAPYISMIDSELSNCP